ncbi:hypothetical protein TNCV_3967361 [Trichonephila clavipes]|nr:hypothetical protein TNCV_3967361 [Trichonephila clavipes]
MVSFLLWKQYVVLINSAVLKKSCYCSREIAILFHLNDSGLDVCLAPSLIPLHPLLSLLVFSSERKSRILLRRDSFDARKKKERKFARITPFFCRTRIVRKGGVENWFVQVSPGED